MWSGRVDSNHREGLPLVEARQRAHRRRDLLGVGAEVDLGLLQPEVPERLRDRVQVLTFSERPGGERVTQHMHREAHAAGLAGPVCDLADTARQYRRAVASSGTPEDRSALVVYFL